MMVFPDPRRIDQRQRVPRPKKQGLKKQNRCARIAFVPIAWLSGRGRGDASSFIARHSILGPSILGPSILGRKAIGDSLALISILGFVFVFLFWMVSLSAVRADGILDDDRLRRDIVIEKSTAQVFTTTDPLADVFIADPGIADVASSSSSTLYIYGKNPGRTTIVGYGTDGTIRVLINLRVIHDLVEIKRAIADIAPLADIKLSSTPRGILVSGTAQTSSDAENIIRTINHFVEGGGATILDHISVDMPSQVNVRVQIAEVQRNAGEALAINWKGGISKGSDFGAVGAGRIFENLDPPPLYNRGSSDIGLLDSLVIGHTAPQFSLTAMLDILESENLATILAEPNITALDGETANFLAGGEFPIPVSSALGQVNVDYKQYGVSLSFTPTIIDDGRISLRLNSEVSELGAPTGQASGTTLRGVTTRRAETVVELASGESFAIAGLIRNNITSSLKQFPGLGDLPILGALFKSQSFQKNETEMVVIVTPYVVRPVKKRDMLRTPIDNLAFTGRLDKLLFGRLSDDTTSDRNNRAGYPNRGYDAPNAASESSERTTKDHFGGFLLD